MGERYPLARSGWWRGIGEGYFTRLGLGREYPRTGYEAGVAPVSLSQDGGTSL